MTTNLTAFRSIVLGIVLGLALAACGDGQVNPPEQTSTPAQSASASPQSTITPEKTRPTSRYVTRTPTSGPPQPTATAVKTLDVLPDEIAGQKLTFWHPWQGRLGEVLLDLIDEYNRTNRWGVSVEAIAFDGFESLEQAFDTALATGDLPDLMVAYDDRAQHWDQGGQTLTNLQSYIGDPTWGLSQEELDDFYPSFWQQGTAYLKAGGGKVTSRQVSIPFHRSEIVLFYNRSWAVELGHEDFPDTPFELRSQVCNASQARRGAQDEEQTGGLLLSGLPGSTSGKEILLQPEQVLGWIGAFGGRVSLPDGQGYQFETQEAQRAFEFLKDLRQDGCIYLSESPTPAAEFADRQGLVYVASTAELNVIEEAFEALGNRDEWMILPFPTANGATTTVAYGPSLVIPQTSRLQQLAAWSVIEWLVSPQNQARWVLAAGAYPTRFSTNDHLEAAISADPAWASGLELLPNAIGEPPLGSWSVVRWMMGDALAELFSTEFKREQIPDLLASLDELAAEINNQIR